MKAAIVRSYERGPEYGDFEEPVAKILCQQEHCVVRDWS